jgi:hypothetical protein
MRLPWRKQENPWDDELDLGAWVSLPPGSPWSLMCTMNSIMRAQWQLAQSQVRLWKFLHWVGVLWCVLAFLNIWWMGQAKGWW